MPRKNEILVKFDLDDDADIVAFAAEVTEFSKSEGIKHRFVRGLSKKDPDVETARNK